MFIEYDTIDISDASFNDSIKYVTYKKVIIDTEWLSIVPTVAEQRYQAMFTWAGYTRWDSDSNDTAIEAFNKVKNSLWF